MKQTSFSAAPFKTGWIYNLLFDLDSFYRDNRIATHYLLRSTTAGRSWLASVFSVHTAANRGVVSCLLSVVPALRNLCTECFVTYV